MIRRIKTYFFNAFREIFVYHHSSLEFRAKIYTVLIASGNQPFHHYQPSLEEIASEIYHEQERAETLVMTVQEYLKSIQTKKHLADGPILTDIIKELRLVPRYALKIEPDHLIKLQQCTLDEDSKIYQDRLIDFLSQKRFEYETIKH